jgi:nucleoside 2-deoxyribosyltransferase
VSAAIRVYVAHPYTGRERYAYETAQDFCAYAWRRGWHPYSPIAQWHPVATRFGLPMDAASWADLNARELRMSDAVAVLMLTGWQTSVGVAMELGWAEVEGKPVRWFERTHQDGWIEVPR